MSAILGFGQRKVTKMVDRCSKFDNSFDVNFVSPNELGDEINEKFNIKTVTAIAQRQFLSKKLRDLGEIDQDKYMVHSFLISILNL